jgi:hypothetical protein
VSEDGNNGQAAETDGPHPPVENGVDVEQVFDMMLEAEIPTPEEAGYGHGV